MISRTFGSAASALSGPAAMSAAEIREGLGAAGQKTLPSKYLYDAVGSALFEAICCLPEYGVARAGDRILERSAWQVARSLARPVRVAELGSGSGRKALPLLEALASRELVAYHPIDISAAALEQCERELGGAITVPVAGVHAEFLEGLARVARERAAGEHLLVLFLGSTIGNFDRAAADELLRDVREALLPGDALLLATDLVKPVPAMLRAYDDPVGVTAAFDKNLLARVNRELGSDFDLAQFAHEARWNAAERRIEMHLRSRCRQRVRVPGAELTVELEAGETIWTESSHKYERGEPALLGRRAGFEPRGQWVDDAWPLAQTLLAAR